MTDVIDFIPYYPDPTDRLLIPKLGKLKEFDDYRLKKDEIPPTEDGVPMNHQVLQQRHASPFTMYKTGVIYHGKGTGKSVVMSIIQEGFKNVLTNGFPRKPALILVRNSSLRESLRYEIANKATSNVYLPTFTKKEEEKVSHNQAIELSEEAKTSRLNANIAKVYTILTYEELLSRKKYPTDSYIEKHYNDINIFVDEAHNIREQSDNPKVSRLYKSLWKFLHTVKGCNIYLSTGNPIWDKVYDIAGLINLILEEDKQMPTRSKFVKTYFQNGKLIPEKIDELRDIFRGKFSFLRQLTSTAKKEVIGVSAPWLKYTKIYPCMMDEFQAKYVDQAREQIGKGKGLAVSERDASNGVYPVFNSAGEIIGGAYGSSKFMEYASVIKSGTTGKTVYKFTNKYLREALGPSPGKDRYASLKRFNTKAVELIKLLLDPKRMDEKVFIYGDSVTGTGGDISLALILTLWGFTWAKNPDTLVPSKRTPASPGTLFLITSDSQTIHTSSEIKNTLKVWNKPANRYGAYSRIIIASETFSQGYTLKDVRIGVLVSGHWNSSEGDQASNRIYRIGSHSALPPNERYVNYYYFASVKGCASVGVQKEIPEGCVKLTDNVSKPGLYSTEKTVDIRVYAINDQKDSMNSQIVRVIKEESWDCGLNYERNVLPSDIDYSKECDYVKCNYRCDGYKKKDIGIGEKFVEKDQGYIYSYVVAPKDIITTNYNILYSKRRVDELVEEIKDLFGSYFSFPLSEIEEFLIKDSNELPLLLRALDRIINHRVLIKNKYGFGSYLKESGDMYFLDSSITEKMDYLEVYYTKTPLIVERTSMEESVEVIQLREDKKAVDKFVKAPTVEKYNNLSYKCRILLLEAAYSVKKTTKGNSQNVCDLAVTTVLEASLRNELYKMSDGMVVHNLYNSEFTGAGYNLIAQNMKLNGKMRVYNPKYNEWGFVNKKDEKKYTDRVKELLDRKKYTKLRDNEYKMYGIISANQKFKIYDDRLGAGRSGKVCEDGYHIPEIIEIFHHLGHYPYDDEVEHDEDISAMKKSDLIEILGNIASVQKSSFSKNLNGRTQKELVKIYELFGMKKVQLCKSLERWFKGDNPKKISLVDYS